MNSRTKFSLIKETNEIFNADGKPINQSSGGASAFDFSGDGRPGSQSSGGSRGDCPTTQIPLTVLMPDSNFGKTIMEQPTLWFYVPYTEEEIVSGLFSLQDENGVDISEPFEFTLPAGIPGFVSVTLPESMALADLEVEYHWYFEIECDGSDTGVVVDGFIQRVEISDDLSSQLLADSALDDLIYADNQIWYDAIAALAELRILNPDDPELLDRWDALLNANGVSLSGIPAGPFAGATLIESVE